MEVDEIERVLKGLRCCGRAGTGGCRMCPYRPDRCEEMHRDAQRVIVALLKRLRGGVISAPREAEAVQDKSDVRRLAEELGAELDRREEDEDETI